MRSLLGMTNFAVDAAEAGCLDADELHRAGELPHRDAVSDEERLVEGDGERREEILQHFLRGEGHRDAADAEAGDEPGDLDPEVVQRQ
jgi:hypothetical protein